MNKELFERIKNANEEFKELYSLGVISLGNDAEPLKGVHVTTKFMVEHFGRYLTFGTRNGDTYPYYATKGVDGVMFFALLTERELDDLNEKAPSAATE